MEMSFFAARPDGREQQFNNLAKALDHIQGTPVHDLVRPWVYLRKNGQMHFLVVRGRHLDANCLGGDPRVHLTDVELALFESWRHTNPASAVGKYLSMQGAASGHDHEEGLHACH